MSEHLRTVCENWGLESTAFEKLAHLSQDCIHAIHSLEEDDDIPIGASKYGGAPDLPRDFIWPFHNDRPMWFTCQIDLSELPTCFDILPKIGVLSFFYVDPVYRGEDGEGGFVTHSPNRNALSRTPPIPDPQNPRIYNDMFFARALSFRLGKSIPWKLPQSHRDLDEAIDDYVSFFYEHLDLETCGEEFHQLLGLPFGQWNCVPERETGQLLLQLTDQFDDVYFFMSRDELSAKQFSDVRMYFEST